MSLLDNPSTVLSTGRKTVTAAGTPEQISTSNARIISIAIQAETDNTGKIAVGDANIDPADGSERGIILAPGGMVTLNINQLSKVYVDATVNGDGVTFLVEGN